VSAAIQIGDRFGRLAVVALSPQRRRGYKVWICRCDCGAEREITTSNLKRHTRSCGCVSVEKLVAMNTRHGSARKGALSPEFKAWQAMKGRCTYPGTRGFEHYGGRGIKVCERWRDSFENFLADVGPKPRPEYSLDRFPNPNGDYEPGNVRWATPSEQQSNRRNVPHLTIGGVTKRVTEWARELGVSYSAYKARRRAGWSAEVALKTPPYGRPT
jgi:hypothetical protein